MFRFSKAIALIIFGASYWFFPNVFTGFFKSFETGIALAAVVIGCMTLGFLAGKNQFIRNEKTIEKNAKIFAAGFLVYFFILGLIFTIVSLNLNTFSGLENDSPIFDFLPLIAVALILGTAWFLFQVFSGINGLFITPFLIGFYLKKALQE